MLVNTFGAGALRSKRSNVASMMVSMFRSPARSTAKARPAASWPIGTQNLGSERRVWIANS
jgi:hypothetical protein